MKKPKTGVCSHKYLFETLTHAGAAVTVHPGGVRGVGGAGGVDRGGARRCLRILLGQIQDAPHGETELVGGGHRVLCARSEFVLSSSCCYNNSKRKTNEEETPPQSKPFREEGKTRRKLCVQTAAVELPVLTQTPGRCSYKAASSSSSAGYLNGRRAVTQWTVGAQRVNKERRKRASS